MVEDSRPGSVRKCPARLVAARRTVAHPEPHPTKRCIRKCPAHIAAPSGTKTSANRQKSSRIVIGSRLAARLAWAATKENSCRNNKHRHKKQNARNGLRRG